MNALLIYPQFPDTYWSFKHALSFLGKRAAQPPLGLMTIGALVPRSWNKHLVDENVERLRDRDLAWADVALISAMHIQKDALFAILARCRAFGLRTVVGGPIASSLSAPEIDADHVVIGEAESLIATLARDLEHGAAKPVYQAAERPAMETSPLPDLSLIKMHRYSTMAVQYSRGCPFNCEFCDIIEIYGRRPRTKAVEQVIAELDQLHAAGWRESVFIVDDNFIGNKARAKELCAALANWRSQYKTCFDFNTEASLNLADDPELMQLMKDAGFVSVFLGIETPDESGLVAANKLQNTRRSLLESVAIIQSFGIAGHGRLHPRIRYRPRRHLRSHDRLHPEERHPRRYGRVCCRPCRGRNSSVAYGGRAASCTPTPATTPASVSTSFPEWTHRNWLRGIAPYSSRSTAAKPITSGSSST